MPTSVENIMKDKIKTTGFIKFTNEDNIHFRVIRIGNEVNCNGEIIKNFTIKDEIIKFLNKYNIEEYLIRDIDDKFEFSYQLEISNDNYEKLIENIESYNKSSTSSDNSFNREILYY